MKEREVLERREREVRERLGRRMTRLAETHPLVAVGTAAATGAVVAGVLGGGSARAPRRGSGLLRSALRIALARSLS